MTTKQVVPVIHINGTSAEALLTAYDTADRALALAQIALEECSPHARDYYPQESSERNDPFAVAVREHMERCESLARLRAQLVDIADAVRNQRNDRNLRRAFSSEPVVWPRSKIQS
jgi:hypothetical protein